jgi:hypothetical protein
MKIAGSRRQRMSCHTYLLVVPCLVFLSILFFLAFCRILVLPFFAISNPFSTLVHLIHNGASKWLLTARNRTPHLSSRHRKIAPHLGRTNCQSLPRRRIHLSRRPGQPHRLSRKSWPSRLEPWPRNPHRRLHVSSRFRPHHPHEYGIMH